MFNYIVLSTMLHDRMITWYMCCNSVFNSPDTDMLITLRWYVYTWHLIPNTWYLTLVLDMSSLNTWSLTPDTWHMIYDTWQLTCYHSLDMLSHSTSTLDLMLWHLIGLLLHLYYNVYSWLPLLWELGMIIILLPDMWYSWTPVLLNSCIPKPL